MGKKLAERIQDKVNREKLVYAATVKERALNIFCKVTLITMNEVFGIGMGRAQTYWDAFQANLDQLDVMSENADYEYIEAKLDERVAQITKGANIEINTKV